MIFLLFLLISLIFCLQNNQDNRNKKTNEWFYENVSSMWKYQPRRIVMETRTNENLFGQRYFNSYSYEPCKEISRGLKECIDYYDGVIYAKVILPGVGSKERKKIKEV
jgi:hypothetical protein